MRSNFFRAIGIYAASGLLGAIIARGVYGPMHPIDWVTVGLCIFGVFCALCALAPWDKS